MRPIIQLRGQTFDRWTVLDQEPEIRRPHGAYWECICICGNKGWVRSEMLRTNRSRSCGCLQKEWVAANKPARTHGQAGGKRNPVYNIWNLMVHRCTNPNIKEFKNYGGRGITVCDRWRTFENFFADMGNRPSAKHSIDRRDNDGNYCLENCHWATKLVQANNTRTNHFIEFNGKRLTQAQWDRELGYRPGTVKNRIGRLGWTIEKALTQPFNEAFSQAMRRNRNVR